MAASVTDSVAVGSNTPSTTLETLTSLTPTGSNKAIYVLMGSGATTPSNPSALKYASASGVGGEDFTQVDTTRTVSTNLKCSIFKLIGPAAASGTIWGQWASADDERWLIAVAVKDTDGTIGAVAYSSGTISSAISTSAAATVGELILAFASVLDVSGGPATLTAGQTSLKELDTATPGATGIGPNEAAGAESTTATSTSQAMTWTLSATRDWGQFAFQVNPGAAGVNNQLAWIAA